jgi:hypothetical protein
MYDSSGSVEGRKSGALIRRKKRNIEHERNRTARHGLAGRSSSSGSFPTSPPPQKILGWNWYVRGFDEIFLDLDSKRSLFRALQVFRRNESVKLLPVDSIYLYPSKTQNHYHVIVEVSVRLDATQAALWALWAGSDRLRGIYVLERIRRGVIHADVISTPYVWFRPPDAYCMCKDKHKRKWVTDRCPAMTELLMDARSSDYFPRNKDRKTWGPRDVPYGRISKRLLIRGG